MQRLILAKISLFYCEGKLRKNGYFIIIVAFVISVFLRCVINFDVFCLPDNMYTNFEEVENINSNSKFGLFVKAQIEKDELSTGISEKCKNEIIFKLFGFIPIKKVKVNILPEEEVFLGGQQIGLVINTDGVVVSSDCIINNENLKVEKNKILQNGDVVQKIEYQKVKDINELKREIKKAVEEGKSEIKIDILRKGKELSFNYPILKNADDKYTMGFWGRDSYSGIGTLSFVMSKTNKFGALGHSVSEESGGQIIPMVDGAVYSCNLVGIEKGKTNQPGQLRCVFVENNSRGIIEKNTKVGIFGQLTDAENTVDVNKRAKLGGRLSVKTGRASIISNISGISQEYEIEIIKINNQAKSDDKSFVFRVVDRDLLALTGGIVQGMSGSPIMQNGKVIGAVTHVFVSDSTLGYGVYTDWMLENLL